MEQTHVNTELVGPTHFESSRLGVGVVAPYDFALDDEYWRWVGKNVNVYITRTPYLDLTVSVEMAAAVSSLADATAGARAVMSARPASVLYACTSGSFVGGRTGERALRQAIEDAVDLPAVTTSGALLDALEELDVNHVAIATPYDRDVSDHLTQFLTESGCQVENCSYLGLDADIANVDANTIRSLARAADSPRAEALFLSCTNLRTFDILSDLEEELGKPVLSANQVSFWAALRAGRLPPLQNAGSLGIIE